MVKTRGIDKYDVYLGAKYVKRVHDKDTATMLEMSGKRMLALGKPLREVVRELRGEDAAGPKFGTYAKEWLAAHNGSPSTKRSYGEAIRRALPVMKNLSLDDIDLNTYNKLVDSMGDKAPATMKQTVMVIKSIQNDAVDEGVATLRPPRRIKRLPRAKQVRPGFALTREQHEALVAQSPTRYRAMFAVWPYIGARVGEMFALEWCDIDWDKRTIRIERQVHRNGKTTPTKNGKVRYVDMVDRVYDELKAWRELNPCDLLWPSETGDYLPRTSLGAVIRDTAGKAGVEGMHSHIFRQLPHVRKLANPGRCADHLRFRADG